MSALSDLLKDVQECRYKVSFNDVIDWMQYDLCMNCSTKWRKYLMPQYNFYYKADKIYTIANTELSKLYDMIKETDGEARAYIQGVRYGIIKLATLIGESTPDFEKPD